MLLALALAGCASTAPPAAAPREETSPRPLVHLVVDPASDEMFLPRVEKLLTGTGLPADLFLGGEPPRPVDFTVRLKFQFRELPLTDFEGIWALTDALLLTLYPATCNRYRFALDATVLDGTGREFRSYSQQDVDTAWVWLLIGPKCASPEGLDGDDVGDAAEQLLEAVYRRMAQEGVLDPSRTAEFTAARGPLVYVTTDRAEELVREGFRLVDSPLRFSFDPADAPVAEYTLRLNLVFSGLEYSAGRAYLALLTAGLSGACPTHTATLEGSAFDRHGKLVAHYVADDDWRPTMATNCALVDEGGRPEVVRELARDLMRQVTVASLSAAAVATGDVSAPLVRISTNSARTAVERVTSEYRPFAQVTLDDPPAAAPDYLLDLQFTASGGGSRLDPAASLGKQIAMGALVGLTLGSSTVLCKPKTYVLAATLSDRTGADLARYEATRSARPEGGCFAGDEPEPQVASALLKSVYEQMARDSKVPPALRRPRQVRLRSP
jgi:hypothetical protein